MTEIRAEGCASIYLPTTPVTQEIETARIELGNFARDALEQLQKRGLHKRDLDAISEALDDLADDDGFWAHQAHSLAIFVTPDRILTYRLPNRLAPLVMVSDRLHLKPLFRTITFPHSAFVLALAENSVRLVEIDADLPPREIKVGDMPKDVASAAGLASIKGRGHYRRMGGTEGQNVRLEQYARKIDTALRTVLTGRETPLILAATGRLASVFRRLNTYPHLLEGGISDNPEQMSEAQLAAASRPVLDASYEAELADLRDLYERRSSEQRTTTDISDAARAATFGAIQVLLVDIDAVVPGQIDADTGAVTFSDISDVTAYGVVDEITARALASGARILGVRRQDLPGGKDLAAILRYPL
nr:hypothetical protein [Pseudogemmobacter hezensis]